LDADDDLSPDAPPPGQSRGSGLLTAAVALAFVASIAFIALAGGRSVFAANAGAPGAEAGLPVWAWSVILFFVTLLIGVVAVLAGVGGGVMFVPILVGFSFPFHADFVRGAGLTVALATALAAGPKLLRSGMASFRLAVPAALVASVFAIVGAIVGLSLPQEAVQIALGVVMLGVVCVLAFAKRTDPLPSACLADGCRPDRLAEALDIGGAYRERSSGEVVTWKPMRTACGLVGFSVVGLLAGMFGMGAGWANVPVLNLVMCVPLKVAVATSVFLLSITDTAAFWVYFNRGAVLPAMVVPCVAGVMIGSRVGVRLLSVTKPLWIRRMVIAMLLLAGARAVLKGAGVF